MLATQTRSAPERCRSCWSGASVATVWVMLRKVIIIPKQTTTNPAQRLAARTEGPVVDGGAATGDATWVRRGAGAVDTDLLRSAAQDELLDATEGPRYHGES